MIEEIEEEIDGSLSNELLDSYNIFQSQSDDILTLILQNKSPKGKTLLLIPKT